MRARDQPQEFIMRQEFMPFRILMILAICFYERADFQASTIRVRQDEYFSHVWQGIQNLRDLAGAVNRLRLVADDDVRFFHGFASPPVGPMNVVNPRAPAQMDIPE